MKNAYYTIISNTRIADGVFRLSLEGPVAGIRPGQFVNVALDRHYLRRPFGVSDWSGAVSARNGIGLARNGAGSDLDGRPDGSDSGRLSLVYKVVGEGTAEMSRLSSGGRLELLSFLGNGFDLSMCRSRALVVGGGLGVSPLLGLVKQLRGEGKAVTAVLGFNTAADVILADEMQEAGADVLIATMDGSRGVKGLVTDCIGGLLSGRAVNGPALSGDNQVLAQAKAWDVFYCCGPMVMMKAVDALLEGPGQFSLEQRMGCGFGICYGCSVRTARGPRRVCADGPVFNREDIIW